MAQIFWKLLTPKYALTGIPKSSCFRTPFGDERVHVSETLLKSAQHHFYANFPLFQNKLIWKISLWIRSKMSQKFFNKLTVDHLYSPHSWDKFPQRVQTQLSKKPKRSSEGFSAFLKSVWDFAHLERKDQLDRSDIL